MRKKRFVFSVNCLYLILIAAELAAIIFLCLFIPSVLPYAVTFLGAWIFTAVTFCVMLARAGATEMKLALAALIVLLPVAGAVMYLVTFSKNKDCARLYIADADAAGLEGVANSLCGTCMCGYDRAEYLSCGEQFFNLFFEELEKAEKNIYLEYFIIGRGKIFNRLITALQSAKERGADIKIVLDGVGSAFKVGKKHIKQLKKVGEVKVFSRLSPVPKSRLNFRDHRKIAVFDGKVAFTGGINLADEYANIISPLGYWKDTAVAIYGGAAKVFEGMFLSVWHEKYEMKKPEGGKFKCLPFCDSPPNKSFAESALEYMIAHAEREIRIMTPYFCVGERISSALSFAAQRGVDIKVILPHIPDKRYAYALSKACAAELTCSGVKFYEYMPGFMHAKSVVCDGRAYIGSYNLDFRSFRLNYECGAIFEDDIAQKITEDFENCLALSRPMQDVKCGKAGKISRLFLKVFAPLI